MGLYLNVDNKGEQFTGPKGKADQLKASGATEVPRHELKWQPFLVCVVENAIFDAAGFCYTAQEYMVFKEDRSPRPRRWFIAQGAIESQFSSDTVAEMLAEVKNIPVPEDVFKLVPGGGLAMLKKHFPDVAVISVDDPEDDYPKE